MPGTRVGLAAVAALTFMIRLSAALAQADAGAIVKGTVNLPPDSGSVRDVLVYLDGSIGAPKPGKTVIDQKDMTFVPHVVGVVAGGSVEFLNSDAIMHNVFSTSAAKHFDLGMFSQGESRTVTFETPGIVEIRCNVHPKMGAFVVVLQNNFFATPDARGNFQISGIPPGRYKLRAWHEKLQAAETWVNLDEAKLRNVELRLSK